LTLAIGPGAAGRVTDLAVELEAVSASGVTVEVRDRLVYATVRTLLEEGKPGHAE
jgi:hypothetical protein